MLFEALIRADVADTQEAQEVGSIAAHLRQGLEQEPCCSLLSAANQPEASSQRIQDALLPVATALGFTSEQRGLFHSSVPGLRPDFYRKIGDSGILLEVERGKTTTNNMDLLDFWKCHLCECAHYLFLFVPSELRHNPDMRPKREYEYVLRRLGHFFRPRNYTNVRGLFLFGY